MIVASLITTMSFQAGLTPPSGLWIENSRDAGIASPSPSPQDTTDSSVTVKVPDEGYYPYMVSNTFGFVASLSIILLLISGLPLRKRGLMWILRFIMWIAISASTYTYNITIQAFAGDSAVVDLEFLSYSLNVWMGVMALIFIIHAIRLMVKAVRKLKQFIAKKSNE
ncbi:uncharacterized protein LOC132045563 [Lycium ferocissimum]|uniref:uncharacterized protein LOC132045563 n=1 Tax=Lycium ferocissimum TaxID=112874 RepID=UPI002815B5BD|nr:uncharacterized protein LOC132045563 [Lycium ferocissimum]